jgi:hypothetical protein
MVTMDKNTVVLVAAGLLITIVLFLVNIYIAGFFVIIFFVAVILRQIMEDSRDLPELVAELREDAKAVVIKNTWNSPAHHVHGTLVPLNIEFDIPSLDAEARYEHVLDAMTVSVKVLLKFENEEGTAFSRTYRLDANDAGFEPFKPAFPLFKWK